jgi:two-component system chemotaxis sensor kinase CheA
MMDDTTKLTQLVDQAACCTNMLSPSDLSDARQLEDAVAQIADIVGTLDLDSTDLRQQLAAASAEAAEELRHLLQQDVEDTPKAIEAVSRTICTLQQLIRRVVESGDVDSAQTQESTDVVTNGPSDDDSTKRGAPAADTSEPMTIPEEDAPLVLDFIAEATEHIESAESTLLELESQPGDNELINKMFRSFHTIKGMAGFLNLSEIQSLAHSSENLLDLARKGQLVLAGDPTDVVFESIDMLKTMMAELQTALESGGPVPSHAQLPSLLEKINAASQGQALPATQGESPSPEADKQLDVILDPKSETSKAKGSAASGAHAEEKIKVGITRLDSLINLSGELVIAQLMVSEEVNTGQISQHELVRRVAHQGKIVRELQELSMSMRMVPVQGVFQKMARLARDLSRKASKPVDFITTGEETELDRTVVDKIADPLIHMVRNSVDHGIEPEPDRLKASKNATGRVELRAFHQAGNIVIEIEDDGKGLDKERILKKAADNGVVESGQDMPDDEVFKLVFHPGLSTAEKVTSVSGRGVGMDVVKKNIEALRGKIDISSTRGKGTTFTIRLPLTLAVIDGQVVRIGEERYIIPINSIVRSLRPTRQQLSTVQGRGEMILERGELIPLVRLYRLFNTVPSTEDATESLVVVVEEDGKKCCLLVDDLLGQQQVVIKSLGDALGRVPGVSGGAIMGDGKVTLILDIPGLVNLAQAQ